MRSDKRIVSFPSWNPRYNWIITEFFKSLGLEVLPPKFPSKRAMDIAISKTPEMICTPLKITLASFIEALEKGANTLIMWVTTKSRCRFHTYYIIQEQILKNMGFFDFEMFGLRYSPIKLVRVIKKIAPEASYRRIFKSILKVAKEIDGVEPREHAPNDRAKIGLVGEIYTLGSDETNMHLKEKLERMNCFVDNSITLSRFVRDGFKNLNPLRAKAENEQKAWELLPEPLGGHGHHSIRSTLDYIDKGYDGIVFCLPLSCMPENTVMSIVQGLCRKVKMPLLVLKFAGKDSEQNFNTRIEAFAETLKLKRGAK